MWLWLAKCLVQPPDGNGVNRRAEVEVTIGASHPLRNFDIIQLPMLVLIRLKLKTDRGLPDPTLHFCLEGAPGSIADHLVAQLARLLLMQEYSHPCYMPV
jgi:hypothetical protein